LKTTHTAPEGTRSQRKYGLPGLRGEISPSIGGRRYTGSPSPAINSISFFVPTSVVKLDSQTYSSARLYDPPYATTQKAATSFVQNMSSWPPRRIDALPPTRPVANGLVNAHKQRPWHTEATLKRLFSIHSRPPVHSRKIPHDAAHTLVEITWPVGTPPGNGPDKTPTARSLRRILAMTAHQEQRSRSKDGRNQLVDGALRLLAAVIARRPRPTISRRVHLHPRMQPMTGELERPQKRPQTRPSTRPLTPAHARCSGEGDGEDGEAGRTTSTTMVPQSRSPLRRRCDRCAAVGRHTTSLRAPPPTERACGRSRDRAVIFGGGRVPKHLCCAALPANPRARCRIKRRVTPAHRNR